jgi:hypothetical protein
MINTYFLSSKVKEISEKVPKSMITQIMADDTDVKFTENKEKSV